MKKTETKKQTKKTFERTIDEDLFNAWKMLYRTGDIPELMELTGKSYPIIQNALHKGHVKSESVCDTISKFYIERREKQKEQARKIASI